VVRVHGGWTPQLHVEILAHGFGHAHDDLQLAARDGRRLLFLDPVAHQNRDDHAEAEQDDEDPVPTEKRHWIAMIPQLRSPWTAPGRHLAEVFRRGAPKADKMVARGGAAAVVGEAARHAARL